MFFLFFIVAAVSAGDIDNIFSSDTLDSPPITPSISSPADEFQKSVSSLPECPMPPYMPVEHSDGVCNRIAQNDPSIRLARRLRHRSMPGHHAVNRIADQRTWICPGEDMALDADDEKTFIVGQQSRWIVKNASSGPVVIAWLHHSTRREVSATNPKIYPAFADPAAILQPGQWMSVLGYQGHVFHARELLTIDGQLMPGRLLLRHRPGLIPIRNRLAEPEIVCPGWALADPDPHKGNKNNFSQRTPENNMEHCNALHKGFVNRVGCPVDLYFAGSADSESKAQSVEGGGAGSDLNANKTRTYTTTCHETFKMHLGLNPSPRNYADDWDSPVKFEGTYLTHKFVARLRHDPDVVVDEVVIREDVIGDCPDPKKPKVKSQTGPAGVPVLTGVDVSLGGGEVLSLPYVHVNATDGTIHRNATDEARKGHPSPAVMAPMLTAAAASH